MSRCWALLVLQAVLQNTGRFGGAGLTMQECFDAALVTNVPSGVRLLRCFEESAEEVAALTARASRQQARGVVPGGLVPGGAGQVCYGPCPHPELEAFITSMCCEVSGDDSITPWYCCWYHRRLLPLLVPPDIARQWAACPAHEAAKSFAKVWPSHFPGIPLTPHPAGRLAGAGAQLGGAGAGAAAVQHEGQPLLRQRGQAAQEQRRLLRGRPQGRQLVPALLRLWCGLLDAFPSTQRAVICLMAQPVSCSAVVFSMLTHVLASTRCRVSQLPLAAHAAAGAPAGGMASASNSCNSGAWRPGPARQRRRGQRLCQLRRQRQRSGLPLHAAGSQPWRR